MIGFHWSAWLHEVPSETGLLNVCFSGDSIYVLGQIDCSIQMVKFLNGMLIPDLIVLNSEYLNDNQPV